LVWRRRLVWRHETADIEAGAVEDDLTFEAALKRFAGRSFTFMKTSAFAACGASDARQDGCAGKLADTTQSLRPYAGGRFSGAAAEMSLFRSAGRPAWAAGPPHCGDGVGIKARGYASGGPFCECLSRNC
jgi:hypothetical protein